MTFYITTPLFYVNDLPHIGSAYPTIAADFLAGHMRQRGETVSFLTGTDEHGQKIEQAAASNNKSPKDHCDYIAEEFKKLWQILNINYDYFIRTSNPDHKKFVSEFFERVRANGDIYVGQYKGLYCSHCEDFWLEKDLLEEGEKKLCPTHKKPVEEYSQENYFFALSKYQNKLEKYIADNPEFISPDYRRNEVLGWIKEGLRDFPISRVGLEWGIPVPGDSKGQKIYVWFDALLGYLSGLGDKREQVWSNDSTIVHIIGKDILRFHAVYWPAMLMSAGMPLPKRVFGHGFLTKDGMKMGKTLGNIIDPIDLCNRYGAEAVKFYFLRDMVFGRDGDYTDTGFIQKLNSDLANNLGNLLSRALNLINKYCDGIIPDTKLAADFENQFQSNLKEFTEHIDQINPYNALELVFKTLDQVNILINDVSPWKILKQAEISADDREKALASLVTASYACYKAAILLAPIMPSLTSKVLINLGISHNETDRELLTGLASLNNYNKKLQGLKIASEVKPIFQRLEAGSLV